MSGANSSSNGFHFPEMLSVEGVSMISEGERECEESHRDHHHVRDAFLHSTHDPLLTAERRSVALFDAV